MMYKMYITTCLKQNIKDDKNDYRKKNKCFKN